MDEEQKAPEVQEPEAPSPDDIFSSALGGSSLADYLGGDDEPATPMEDPENVTMPRETVEGYEARNCRPRGGN